jgi:hypothetical protein
MCGLLSFQGEGIPVGASGFERLQELVIDADREQGIPTNGLDYRLAGKWFAVELA